MDVTNGLTELTDQVAIWATALFCLFQKLIGSTPRDRSQVSSQLILCHSNTGI